jgi:hypothetical protein
VYMPRLESHHRASKVDVRLVPGQAKASAAVRLPSSIHARANRIVAEAAGPYTVACDGNGSSGARGETASTSSERDEAR